MAVAFAIHYLQPRTPAQLQHDLALATTRAGAGVHTLLEVTTDRTANAAVHAELRDLVERALRDSRR